MNKKFKERLQNQRGNALFLILIAVALFAALSYAVTQSGGGGGTIDREQNLISAAQLTQYPAFLRTTVTRMVLTGTARTGLSFDSTPLGTNDDEVFGTQGGGVPYQLPPSSSGSSAWGFSHDIGGEGLYINGSGSATGVEIIAYADGITLNVCEQIRRGLGLAATPTIEGTAVVFPVYNYGTIPPSVTSGGGAGSDPIVDDADTFFSDIGESFSCVKNGGAGANHVYYHALLEQ